MDRRTKLLAAASDYVLAHGLIDLSLRPLAAAIGTSDRMLLYHFSSKDELVAAVLDHSSTTSLAKLAELEPQGDIHGAVLHLWQQLSGRLASNYRVYIEASALGLLGREPYAAIIGAGNQDWRTTMRHYFVQSGAPKGAAERIATLADAAFMGLFLDLPLSRERPAIERTVLDLADAAAAMASTGTGS